MAKDSPKMGQDAPKMPQDSPKMAQRCPKMTPKGLLEKASFVLSRAGGMRGAIGIRPLPGFSLGAVLRFFCPTRLSQSVQVCHMSTEFSPRTPAHSAGPGRSLLVLAISEVPILVQKCVPFRVLFWRNFGSQNGPQSAPKNWSKKS